MDTISWEDFEKVELRVGTIVDVQDFPEARKPSSPLDDQDADIACRFLDLPEAVEGSRVDRFRGISLLCVQRA